MSILLTEGRFSQPKRLIELGFWFQFDKLEHAMEDRLVKKYWVSLAWSQTQLAL
jgi:NAD dependent epimerase/dehydratase family enzyme